MRYIFTLLFTLCCAFLLRAGDTIRVSGTIIDDGGERLIGASVLLKGTTCGTVTDMEGNYTLTCIVESGKNLEIEVTYTGFEAVTASLENFGQPMNITMNSNVNQLSEVVVTAVGTRKYKRVLGYNNKKRERWQVSVSDEQYNPIHENGFIFTATQPVSTISTDVDRASYANVRRYLNSHTLPPEDAVRSEEMINYFNYNDVQPRGVDPLAITTEWAACPWNSENKVLRVGMQAKKTDIGQLPASNLVFLIDVSGSMQAKDKLTLLKQSLRMLVGNLRPIDQVSLVVYAGAAGLVLPPTPAKDSARILAALNKLEAGGSTAGAQGIRLAYEVAQKAYIPGGNNRIILATDGDFNVGIRRQTHLVKLIEQMRKSGVYLTVLGFGTGNYQEGMMQDLANRGNGNHAYIDGINEARKVLLEEFGGTLFTIAKDVKAQIQFSEDAVTAYRLIGYENRLLNEEDFKNDSKDAAEIGSDHQVTILYEIVPKNMQKVDSLGIVKLRYKLPKERRSKEMMKYINIVNTDEPSEDICWSMAVAEFAMLLRESDHLPTIDWNGCIQRAEAVIGEDPRGYRSEMVGLIRKARDLHVEKVNKR